VRWFFDHIIVSKIFDEDFINFVIFVEYSESAPRFFNYTVKKAVELLDVPSRNTSLT
jgi:hypothetical protein